MQFTQAQQFSARQGGTRKDLPNCRTDRTPLDKQSFSPRKESTLAENRLDVTKNHRVIIHLVPTSIAGLQRGATLASDELHGFENKTTGRTPLKDTIHQRKSQSGLLPLRSSKSVLSDSWNLHVPARHTRNGGVLLQPLQTCMRQGPNIPGTAQPKEGPRRLPNYPQSL